jgi:hypothetical protein
LLDESIDPSEKRKQNKIGAKVENANMFGVIAREYIQKRLVEKGRAQRIGQSRLETD